MTPKQELLNEAAREYRAFHEAVKGLNEEHGSHEAFMHAASAVPEERFERGRTAYRIVDQNTAHHSREHAEQIRAWRASRGL